MSKGRRGGGKGVRKRGKRAGKKGRMSKIASYKVVVKGRPASVEAAVEGERVRVYSLRFDGERDRRGQPVDQTLVESDPDGAGSQVTAFSALSPEERQDLFRQVRAAHG